MILYMLIGLIFILLSFLMFKISLMLMLLNNSMFLEWNLLVMTSIKINMLLYIDWISMIFIFTVMIISSMILIYSIEYMYMDKMNNQFFYLMILFMLSMMLMIISPNLITILLGWDGLGLISYCLVIFYQSKYSYSSGNLTIFSNLIGDIMLILSIAIMFMMGSWNFINLKFNNWNLLISILIIITSFTKSAQLPFSSWLPVAMAAPTPVSSLVHSSTLVTAGIYLLILFSNLINKNLLIYIMIISMMTMIMASMSAMFEFDFKKIIAYSTLSQLGLMMMIISMMKIDLSFFHLIIHAMFKSMMFMCSGIFIHNLLNYQDILYYGNMKMFFPLTCMMFLISNLSLSGMPFLSGFFSKDKILEYFITMNLNLLIYFFMMVSIMLTLIYSFLLIYYLINLNFNFMNYNLMMDSKLMNYSMYILMLFSMLMGMLMNWIIFFSIELIFLFYFDKILIIFMLLMGLIIGMIMFKIFYNNILYKFKYFFGKMWFSYNLIYKLLGVLIFGKNYYLFMDKGWSEILTKNLLTNLLLNNYLLNLNLNNFMMIMLLMNYLIIMNLLI